MMFAATLRVGSRAPQRQDAGASECESGPRRDIAVLERCLALDPGDIDTALELGVRYESAGSLDRAETLYRRALEVDPLDGDVRIRLGRLLFNRGDAAGARREGEIALKVQPGNAAARTLASEAGAPRGSNR